MKKSEVPQDKSFLSENNLKEICYAINEKGEYTTIASQGWEVKNIAINASLSNIQDRIDLSLNLIKLGKLSPIAYYMELNKMDINILSGYTGYSKWRIKRHLKPNIFKKLTDKQLKIYCDVFNININSLLNFKVKK
ncbi:MAG: hypothetical protein KC414_13665 [Romboutsia sp.]|nr:hypothetical protein [Romboutsia sp.]